MQNTITRCFGDIKKILLLSFITSFATFLNVDAADTLPSADTAVEQPEISSGEPDYARLRRTIEEYEISIAEIEKTDGAYAAQLGEVLTGIGLAYKELGRYRQAVEALNKALHIVRVNQGPDSPSQLPVLEQIISANTAASDWEALDENYQLFYTINQRNLSEDDPRLLDVIYRLTRWHLNQYLNRHDPVPFKHLLQAETLFQDAVAIIEKYHGPDDPLLIEALNGIAVANYHIASHIFNANSTDEMEEIRSSTLKVISNDEIAADLPWHPIRYSRLERRKVLKKIVEIHAVNPGPSLQDRVTALVNLGDWYLIYGWHGSAMKNYRKAYQLLADHDSSIDDFFGKPVRLPALTAGYPEPDGVMKKNKSDNYVRLSIEVSDSGCVRRIKVVGESHPENMMARKHAKDFLRSSLFRPRFEDGDPVLTRNLTLELSGDVLERESDRKLVNYEQYPDFVATQRCNRIR